MKYWQKIFLFTLLLFLFAFNAGAFLLADAAYETALASERERAFTEHGFIADAFARDFAAALARGTAAEKTVRQSLYKNYADYYAAQGLYLALRMDGDIAYSNLPDQAGAPGPQAEGVQASAVRGTDGAPCLYVEGSGEKLVVTGNGEETKYSLITARSIAGMQARMDTLTRTLVWESIGISLALCAALMLMLKRLTQPIQTLSGTARAIASGSYGVRAQVFSRDEVGELARSFNHMAGEIQAQMGALSAAAEQKQRFIDDLAHEMRTPLTAIGGYAQYLLEAAITEEERFDALAYIRRESVRLSDLSEKLLLLTRLREDEPAREPISLRELFADIAATVGRAARKRGVVLHIGAGDTVWNSDGALLYMLFLNLVQNALRAAGKGGNVWITADAAHACVRDDGCGIAPDALRHITEPFFRVDKSRSRSEGGAGLGLALCSRIAQRLELELTFDSEMGRGTTAVLSFLQLSDNSVGTS